MAIHLRVFVFGLAVALLLPAAGLWAQTRVEPVVNDEGLYTQPWFLQSFLDLRQDLAESHASGKRLVVVWEQRGCPYCKELHTVNLANPGVQAYVRQNFNVIQLNLYGDREVTDFDGQAVSEKNLARKWAIQFTPTLIFFPETLGDGVKKSGSDIEVARMPGLFRSVTFLGMFRYVREKQYPDKPFQRYLNDVDADLRKQTGTSAR